MDTEPSIVDHTTDLGSEQDTDDSVELVEDELLVEEISIDGMCGVY